MDREMAQQEEKEASRLVFKRDVPAGEQTLKSGWKLETKFDKLGRLLKLKGRNFVKGCGQRPGSVGETFAATPRLAAVKLLISIAAAMR